MIDNSEDLDRAFSIKCAAEESPDAVFIRDSGRDYSFKEVASLAADVEKRLPVQPYHPLIATPTLETVLTAIALLERKEPILLLHPGLTQKERDELLEEAKEQEDPLPEGTAIVLFTSGTTGKPKPAILSRRALFESAKASAGNIPLRQGDVWQLSISPARIGGFSIISRSLIARSIIAIAPKFNVDEYIKNLDRDSVNYSSIVPTMLQMIFDKHPQWRPNSQLKALLVGGAPLSKTLKVQAKEKGIPIILTYGMTETASNVVTTPYAERYEICQGCGKINPGVQLRTDNDRIYVKGPMLMTGYWGKERIDSERWFDTGDIGEIQKDGSVQVFARRTDLILSGGENVYPAEVEEALEAVKGVKQALVCGLPDKTWGAVVTALLVASNEADLPSDKDIVKGLSSRLAKYKSPRRYAWVKEIPTLPSGKPNRNSKVLEGLTLNVLHYTK